MYAGNFLLSESLNFTEHSNLKVRMSPPMIKGSHGHITIGYQIIKGTIRSITIVYI